MGKRRAELFLKAGCGACKVVPQEALAELYELQVHNVTTADGLGRAAELGFEFKWPALVVFRADGAEPLWEAHLGPDGIRVAMSGEATAQAQGRGGDYE